MATRVTHALRQWPLVRRMRRPPGGCGKNVVFFTLRKMPSRSRLPTRHILLLMINPIFNDALIPQKLRRDTSSTLIAAWIMIILRVSDRPKAGVGYIYMIA